MLNAHMQNNNNKQHYDLLSQFMHSVFRLVILCELRIFLNTHNLAMRIAFVA